MPLDEIVVTQGFYLGTVGVVVSIRQSNIYHGNTIVYIKVKTLKTPLGLSAKKILQLYSYKLRKVKVKKIRKFSAWK